MSTQGSSFVLDTHLGKKVYSGNQTDAEAFADQQNAGYIQLFATWERIATNFVVFALESNPLPWRIELRDVGADVLANDGIKIVSSDSMEMAAFIIRLAERLELERYPDGRPRPGHE
jgi:hypothetical protein